MKTLTTPSQVPVVRETDLTLPAVLSAAPSAFALVKALRRRWRLAIGVATVCAVVSGALCWFFLPPAKHTARTLLRIPPGSPFLFRTSEPIPNLQDHQRNQVAMVKSRLVLNSALKDRKATDLALLRDKPDPIQWLEREVQADFNVAPEVLRITIDGDEPSDMVVLVNVVRDAYLREIVDKERIERIDRATRLRQLREEKERELRARKEEQRKFEQMAGGKDTGVRSLVLAFTQQQLNFYERDLIQTQSDLRRARAELAARQTNPAEAAQQTIPDPVVDDQLNKEPAVQAARAGIQQLQMVLEDTIKAARDGERNPKAQEFSKKIEEAEKSLVVLRKRLLPSVIEDLRQRRRYEQAATVQQLQSRIVAWEQDEKVLSAEIANLRKAIKDKSDNVSKAEAEREDMTQLESMTSKIVDEEEKLKIELGAPARHSVLEEGIVTKPLESKRALIAAGATGASTFALIIFTFAFLEFRQRRVYSPDEIVFGLGLPMVGAIPDTTSRVSAETDEPTYLCEAVDTFRTMLLRTAKHDELRVVMITSAQSGEGKTTLSTQLASSLAQIGYSTLFIDGDLRNPVAHRVFEIDRGPGLCDVLRNEVRLEDVIRTTSDSNLSVITAGRWDGGASRALAQDSARQLIVNLRNRFDFVIIDSSPVLPVVDPLLLGQYSDGAIISVLREVSRMANVYAAFQRLTDSGVRVVGAVMSGVRGEQYGADYYPYQANMSTEEQTDPNEVVEERPD